MGALSCHRKLISRWVEMDRRTASSPVSRMAAGEFSAALGEDECNRLVTSIRLAQRKQGKTSLYIHTVSKNPEPMLITIRVRAPLTLMATAKINILDEPPDFSIVLGGPLFQLLRRAHLGGDHLELLYRRMIFFVGITWLPLFLLATVGPFAGSTGRLAFLRDIEVHARFLVALPALIAAELLIHLRMLPLARRFV